MPTRSINLNYTNLPEPRVISWLEANGISPADTPAAQEVLVTDDHMAYVAFDYDEEGRKVRAGHDGYRKHIKVVPLISAPEAHGL
jgi:YD repeat-containing protein